MKPRAISFSVLMFLVAGCAGINYHKNFTIYKQSPFKLGDISVLDGVYFCSDKPQSWDYYAFFPDGLVYRTRWHVPHPTNDPETYIKKLVEHGNWKFGIWGHFVVRRDSLYIQYFTEDNNNFKRRNTRELWGAVINDRVIRITTERCDWCVGKYAEYDRGPVIRYQPPREYRLYPTDFRPDTTQVWFKHKRWYRRGVWYNKSEGN